MEIIEKRLKEIKPYENNPRNNDDAVEFVMNSIREFGFKVPIVIDKNGVIVTGHTRYRAAKKLRMSKVPCIVADDLTDDQVKAFRLADNKVSEQAEWDNDLLNIELEALEDVFSMESFGFDFTLSGGDESGIQDDDDEEEKTNEQERTIYQYNLDFYKPDRVAGKYDIPILNGTDYIPKSLKAFHHAMEEKQYEGGICFHEDDYRFERIWTKPVKYTEIFRRYECIIEPDFSVYRDMPYAMKLWNVYRSRLLAQAWQDEGMIVIPEISFCDEDTYEFVFDGLPQDSVYEVSTIGLKRDKAAWIIWQTGMKEFLSRITPKAILLYGDDIEYDFGDIPIYKYRNERQEAVRNLHKNEKQ